MEWKLSHGFKPVTSDATANPQQNNLRVLKMTAKKDLQSFEERVNMVKKITVTLKQIDYQQEHAKEVESELMADLRHSFICQPTKTNDLEFEFFELGLEVGKIEQMT